MHKTETRTGADLLADALKSLGMRRAFGVCADQTNPIFVGLAQRGIEVIGTRNESGAIHMADGSARATGEPGVAIVGGGPGHVASVAGVAVAQSTASPVLVISGQPSLSVRERNGHQILYQADIMRSLSKWSLEMVSPEVLAEFAARSWRVALAGKPGPVSLSIPIDVLEAPIPAAGSGGPVDYRVKPLARGVETLSAASGEGIAEACALLATAKTPLMIVGGGAWWEMSQGALAAAVAKLEIPVFTLDQARGLIPDDGDRCFGYAHPSFNRTFRRLAEADVVLYVGTEVFMHTATPQKKLFHPDSRIIQLHSDMRQIGIVRAADVAVVGPLEPSLTQLAESLKKHPQAEAAQSAWLQEIRKTYQGHLKEWDELHARHASAEAIHPIQLCRSLQRHLKPDVRIVIDGGDFVHWPRLSFAARGAGHWMDGAELGMLGASLPVGIGAQMAAPAVQTWVFIGDGGMNYYAWELATAVQYKVPIKVIVGNDACWGVERRLQAKYYGRTVAVDLEETHFDRFAQLVGAQGFRAERPEELDAVVDAFVTSSGPSVLDVRIPQDCGRPLLDN
jgi:acetolactate synthase I/II/III large subunit